MGEAEPDGTKVIEELERVLASPAFGRSQQVARFLRYIVEARLRGDEAAIKAYAVAVDVFGRPQNFDPQTDPIVRVQARRLRKMLQQFYAESPSPYGVEIVLPTGRYVPEFLGRPAAAALVSAVVDDEVASAAPAVAGGMSAPRLTAQQTRPTRAAGRLLLALALAPSAILLVLVSLWGAVQLGWLRFAAADQLSPPIILIGDFVPVPSWGGDYVSVPGLAVELVTDLQLFDDIDARLNTSEPDLPGAFVLSGLVRPEAGRVMVTATLRQSGTDAVVWSHSIVVPLPGLTERIDDISQRLAEQLGAAVGPLRKPGYDWLRQHPEAYRSGEPYVCRLLAADYFATLAPDRQRQALACAEAQLQRNGESASALSMRAVLRLRAEALQRPPGDFSLETRAAAAAALSKAKSLGGTSASVWFAIGCAMDLLGDYDKALEALRNSLQLNPADLDAQAALGRILVLAGTSPEGMAMASAAISNSSIVPGWYRIAVAVDALRRGQNVPLLRQAQLAAETDSELGAVLAAIGGRRLAQPEVLDRYLSQALEAPRIHRYGIMPVLRSLVQDQALLRTIQAEMSLAGVDLAIINGTGG